MGGTDELNGTERAILGMTSLPEAQEFFNSYAVERLGSAISEVRFRSGRIDVVWGVELGDGREVALRALRPPVDVEAVDAMVGAQGFLSAAGFPCPEPLAGPDRVDGHVLTAETLLGAGAMPDGRDPDHRRLLAEGLVRHILLLQERPDLLRRVGPGPSWCRYQDGPWPRPHDPIVDLSSTPSEFAWLDSLGQRASEQILPHRHGGRVVLGHADWYAGNTAVRDGTLVATYDWELVADTEAVISGFTAASFASSPSTSDGLSSPEEAIAFLRDYEVARGGPMDHREQRAAAGAVTWILAFNARWQVALLEHGIADMTIVSDLRRRQQEYLDLAW